MKLTAEVDLAVGGLSVLRVGSLAFQIGEGVELKKDQTREIRADDRRSGMWWLEPSPVERVSYDRTRHASVHRLTEAHRPVRPASPTIVVREEASCRCADFSEQP